MTLSKAEKRKRNREQTQRWRDNNPHYAEWQRQYRRRQEGCKNPTGETRGGACEICGKVYSKLTYDHDHVTGEHRGWLCNWCNIKLGWFEKWRKQIEAYLSK